ncbi:hypothetical protein CMK19_06750 [Candidatus Poribacteria bacterium]|nr:hypothetical protein [Candidatus Poribacteria bacterium]MEE2909251.1 YibE/F family protein [Candidatus Poribacteria bacterium]
MIVLGILHLSLARFSTIVQHGALDTLLCIGRVIRLNTTESVDQVVTLRITSGRFRGQIVDFDNQKIGRVFSDRDFFIGDRVFLEIPLRTKDQQNVDSVRLLERFRTPFLLYLAGFFSCLMIIVGGAKGIRALLTLVASALTVFYILLPLLAKGYNPIGISLAISAFLTLITFLFITGLSRKMISGLFGTLGGLVAVGILSVLSQKALYLTGLAEEFGYLELGIALWRTPAAHGWNFEGILVAGMILGSVGAMMDVGMSISSAVYEVKSVNPNITVRQAIQAGLNVGRDVMGTMADTLIFAYLGADIITLLLPQIEFPEVGTTYPFLRLLNDEAISASIVQAIVGTIGLVLTVPITAVLAGLTTRWAKPDNTLDKSALPPAELDQPAEPTTNWLVPISLLIVIGLTFWLQDYLQKQSAVISSSTDSQGQILAQSEYAKGKVLQRLEQNGNDLTRQHHVLEVEILSGMYTGQKIVMRNVVNTKMPLLSIPAEPGDTVLCRLGGSPDQIGLVKQVQAFGRDQFIVFLLGLMLICVIVVGREEGIRTVCALVGSGLVIYFFMLPMIAEGKPPVLIVTLSSGLIAFCSLVFVIGPSRKTFSAVLGTMGGVMTAGLIVVLSQQFLHFTGMEDAIAVDIVEALRQPPFDFQQLLLAGMLIGLLGVAVDGAIEVSSSMEEIRRANPNMSSWQLASSGMNVGTDILGTMVNTLVFAYIGVRLLLLMAVASPDLQLFKSPLVELLSVGMMSSEILRILAGTFGLVLTIPITALISAFLFDSKSLSVKRS